MRLATDIITEGIQFPLPIGIFFIQFIICVLGFIQLLPVILQTKQLLNDICAFSFRLLEERKPILLLNIVQQRIHGSALLTKETCKLFQTCTLAKFLAFSVCTVKVNGKLRLYLLEDVFRIIITVCHSTGNAPENH